MANVARVGLLAAAIASMAYGWFTLVALVTDVDGGRWLAAQRGGMLQFLTNCGLILAAVTCSVALVNALVPQLSAVEHAKRTLSLMAIPVSMVITQVYWPLILLAPSLIAQIDTDPGPDGHIPAAGFLYPLPLPLDLSLHAVPIVALLADFLCFEHKYSRSDLFNRGLPLAAIAGLAYAVWVEYCAAGNHTFPYPFLNVPFPARALIYSVVTFVAYLSLLVVNALHPVPHPAEAHYDEVDEWPSMGPWVWFNKVKL